MPIKLFICLGVAILYLFSTPLVHGQIPTQTIRGQVTDAASGAPIPGVSILLLNSDPVKGTTTGANGNFSLQGVAVGRQNLRFSFVGYENYSVSDIMVSSTRETVLNITMHESVTEMEEVVVNPGRIKNQPLNPMAVSSARQLSMEEASRYAGGFDDPARLAASFAGVAGNLQDNALANGGCGNPYTKSFC